MIPQTGRASNGPKSFDASATGPKKRWEEEHREERRAWRDSNRQERIDYAKRWRAENQDRIKLGARQARAEIEAGGRGVNLSVGRSGADGTGQSNPKRHQAIIVRPFSVIAMRKGCESPALAHRFDAQLARA